MVPKNLLSLYVGLALTAGLAASALAEEHRELAIGISQFPSNLNPNIDAMAAKSFVHGLTMRPLTAYDENWELACHLCAELPTLENGKAVEETNPEGGRGVAVTFTIRDGAAWGDGVPVSTRDVMFTWEVGRHPQSGVTNGELYRRLWKIDVVDERTFTFHDRKLSFAYNAYNDFRLLPEHVERPVFEQDPITYRNRTKFDTEPANPGLASGPYRIASYRAGSEIAVERNPSWWGEKPWFDRITVRAIENTAALEANLLSGEIDMIDGELGLSLDQALAFERRNADRFTVFYKPGLTYEHIDARLDNPILADLRVRKALLYGVDRQAISDRLFAGRQPVADTSINPLDWVHTTDLTTYPFEPDRAKALLEEAGWQPGPGGIRQKDGRPLRLKLMSTAGNRSRELIQQVLQSQWRQIGVEAVIENEPPRVFFGETLSRRRFDGLALFAWISSPENVPRSTLHSQEVPTPENGWAGQNYTGFADPRMDELLDAIEVELDRDKRKALWVELQQLYADRLPALPLFFRANAHIWPKWLQGVAPTGHQTPTTMAIERWQVVEP
ncbi:MAG TPA: peptide ABC transporter substrate-binding protein [Geminicoccaceae bacterium]|nr:peptide ABC transporter substrate-binding protein [Geminicoccus sp.]HMU50681.1 peptide ABC transporter substrate-binding protein [Geminicoccaceae bacterium]